MQVRILKPTKSSMQSGDGENHWILVFVKPSETRFRETLMARTSSVDMMNEVVLKFNNLEEAVNYCVEKNYDYEIIKPKKRKNIIKSYADNFL